MPVGTILPYVGELSKIPHGWFICDGTNGTPNLKDRFLQGSNIAGNFIEAGLPNITGVFGPCAEESGFSVSGAFYYAGHGPGSDGSLQNYYVGFDASRSSMIYGNSLTVQPQTYTVYYIMRIM